MLLDGAVQVAVTVTPEIVAVAEQLVEPLRVMAKLMLPFVTVLVPLVLRETLALKSALGFSPKRLAVLL